MTPGIGTVAVVWRGGPAERVTETRNYERLRPILDALSDVGIATETVLHCDENHEATRDQLLRVDGVLVWVDPIDAGEDRSRLDGILREVSSRGVWVSAHPDTIEKMGTKEVLYRTKSLGWGTDTHRYSTVSELREHFPARLAASGPRVLKQNRGNGGIGVWKVALVDDAARRDMSSAALAETIVRVQHAAPRDDVTEDVALADFIDRCAGYLDGRGKLIDQRFVTRLRDGMIRAYLVIDEVVGFARQQPAASVPPDKVLGMPSAKTMSDADDATYADLRIRLERAWVPELCTSVTLGRDDLPLMWDADFLYGPPSGNGTDTYVLGEINVSSVLPFPQDAPRALALAVKQRLDRKR